MRQDIASFGMDLMDMSGAVSDVENAPMRAMFQDALLSAPSGRIAGGSDEILRNIIAERVLGSRRTSASTRVFPSTNWWRRNARLLI